MSSTKSAKISGELENVFFYFIFERITITVSSYGMHVCKCGKLLLNAKNKLNFKQTNKQRKHIRMKTMI